MITVILNKTAPNVTLDGSKANHVRTAEDFFAQNVLNEIDKIRSDLGNYLLIEGMPVSSELPATPTEIRSKDAPELEKKIIRAAGAYLGRIVESKGIEHTLRFPIADGMANEETWHNHAESEYTLFYCIRGEPNTKTYVLNANQLAQNCDPEILKLLLLPMHYAPNSDEFSLLESGSSGYVFSRSIFDRSDFEKRIPNLDLSDAMKGLHVLHMQTQDARAKLAIAYLIHVLQSTEQHFTYKAGDLIILNELNTIRFSPSYAISTLQGEERWLLSLSVERAPKDNPETL